MWVVLGASRPPQWPAGDAFLSELRENTRRENNCDEQVTRLLVTKPAERRRTSRILDLSIGTRLTATCRTQVRCRSAKRDRKTRAGSLARAQNRRASTEGPPPLSQLSAG